MVRSGNRADLQALAGEETRDAARGGSVSRVADEEVAAGKARVGTEHRMCRSDGDPRLAGTCEQRQERRLEARDVEDESARRLREDALEGRRRLVERRRDHDDIGARRVVQSPFREAAWRAGGIGDAHGPASPAKEAGKEASHAARTANEEDGPAAGHRVSLTNFLPIRRKTPSPLPRRSRSAGDSAFSHVCPSSEVETAPSRIFCRALFLLAARPHTTRTSAIPLSRKSSPGNNEARLRSSAVTAPPVPEKRLSNS